MSQATSVSISRENHKQSKSVVIQAIDWSKIRLILQSILLVSFPIITIILSIQTDFLFMTEIISGVCIVALLALVRIVGGRS